MARKAKGTTVPELPVLSVTERTDLEKRVRAEKAYLGEVRKGDGEEASMPASEVLDIDTGTSDRRVRRLSEAITRMGPSSRSLTGAQRQAAEKEHRMLKDWLVERMLTVQEVNAFPSRGGNEADSDLKQAIYEAAVKKCGASDGEMSNAFIKRAERWQNLGRILWPDDEAMSSMDAIRPKGTRSGRHIAA